MQPILKTHQRIRRRFLRRHPKALLYLDFANFNFYRMEPGSTSLNGGFGKAQAIDPDILRIESSLAEEFADASEQIIASLSGRDGVLANKIAKACFSENNGKWTLSNIDPAGFEIQFKDKLRRIEFAYNVKITKDCVTICDRLPKKMNYN